MPDEKINGYGRDVVPKPTPATADEPRLDPVLSPLVLSLSSPVPNRRRSAHAWDRA
jgi:hypothetical protein